MEQILEADGSEQPKTECVSAVLLFSQSYSHCESGLYSPVSHMAVLKLGRNVVARFLYNHSVDLVADKATHFLCFPLF